MDADITPGNEYVVKMLAAASNPSISPWGPSAGTPARFRMAKQPQLSDFNNHTQIVAVFSQASSVELLSLNLNSHFYPGFVRFSRAKDNYLPSDFTDSYGKRWGMKSHISQNHFRKVISYRR